MTSQTSVKANAQAGRFPSLSALKAANNDLLKLRRENGYSSEFLNKIKEFVKLAQATGAMLNVDTERWAGQTLLDYWSNYLYRAGIKLDETEGVLANFDPELAPTLADSLRPYVGLAAFREEAKDKFFGRQKLVEEILKRLGERRFLAVLGPSGSGKSSLVMAGLVPALKGGAINAVGDTPGSKDWRYYPRVVPGADPLLNLAALVRPTTTPDPNWAQAQAQSFMQDAGHLVRLLNAAGSAPAFILVDQFEEIFTLTSDEAVRAAFINNLIKVVEATDVRHTVVVTMRSDFEEFITKIDKLQALYATSNIRVTPLSAAELREAIVQPAESIGLKFEEGIVDQLVHEVLGEPGGLPLLQFTLLKLWDSRKQNLVTWEAFHQLGSCRTALTRAAEHVYNELSPPDQERAKRIFLKLVRPSAGVEVFNNRVPRAQLYIAGEARDHTDRVLAKFLAAGLLRETEMDVPGEAKIEVAHEALIRHWETLDSWLNEERERIRNRLRFADAAKLWDKRHRDSSALLIGRLLEDAQKFEDLTPLEKEFIKASSKRQRGWKLIFYVAVAVILIGSTAFAVASVIGYRQVKAERDRAILAEHISSSRRFVASKRLDLALLLSLKALELKDTPDGRSSLLEALQQSPYLIAYLPGQNSPAVEFAFHDAEHTLFSMNQDGTINSWSTETLKPNSPSGKQIEHAVSVAFSPDRQKVAVSAQDKNGVALVTLIDLSTGQELRKFEVKPEDADSPPSKLLFSPDGQILAGYISADTNKVVLWDVSTGQQQRRALPIDPEGFYELTCMAFSTDGQQFAVGTDEDIILLWSRQGQPPAKLSKKVSNANGNFTSGFGRGVTSLAFRPPENKILVTGDGENNLTFWDVKHQKQLGEVSQQTRSSVTSLAFSPDGKRLASGSVDNSVTLLNTSNDNPLFWGSSVKIAEHSGSVVALTFSPDGTKVVSGDINKNVLLSSTKKFWRFAAPLPVPQDDHPQSPFGTRLLSTMTLSPDGRILAALTSVNIKETALVLWDVAARTPLLKEPLASPSPSPTSQQTDVPSANQSQASRPKSPLSNAIAFSPDNRTVAASRGTPHVILWDISASPPSSWLVDPVKSGAVTALAFNPSAASMLAIASEDNDDHFILNLWDVAANHSLRSLTGHKDRVTCIAFRSDGKVLASGSLDGSVILWDVATGQQLKQLFVRESQAPKNNSADTNSNGIESMAWSRDGKMLTCGDRNSMITLWDMADLANIKLYAQLPTPHDRAVASLAFSPDNTTLASGGYDGTIYLWDVKERETLGPLKIVERPLKVTVAFALDGKTLLSSGDSYNVLLWDMNFETWQKEACKIVNHNVTISELQKFIDTNATYPSICP